jgi:acyl carrier protein
MRAFAPELFTQDLIETLAKLASIPADEIALDDDLREDLGLDSLQSMELLSRISERWGLEIEMEDVVGVRSVRDVVRFVTHLANEGSRIDAR